MTSGNGSPLHVETAALRRETGLVRNVDVELSMSDLETSIARVRDGWVAVELELENVVEAIVARGRIRVVAEAECRRCLEPVADDLDIEVREIYELHPTEGETWPIGDDHVDLEPMVRESILLALPLAPLCSADCQGPQPDRFPTGSSDSDDGDAEPARDPRWAALDQLQLDE